jgi:hypothetical protein
MIREGKGGIGGRATIVEERAEQRKEGRVQLVSDETESLRDRGSPPRNKDMKRMVNKLTVWCSLCSSSTLSTSSIYESNPKLLRAATMCSGAIVFFWSDEQTSLASDERRWINSEGRRGRGFSHKGGFGRLQAGKREYRREEKAEGVWMEETSWYIPTQQLVIASWVSLAQLMSSGMISDRDQRRRRANEVQIQLRVFSRRPPGLSATRDDVRERYVPLMIFWMVALGSVRSSSPDAPAREGRSSSEDILDQYV